MALDVTISSKLMKTAELKLEALSLTGRITATGISGPNKISINCRYFRIQTRRAHIAKGLVSRDNGNTLARFVLPLLTGSFCGTQANAGRELLSFPISRRHILARRGVRRDTRAGKLAACRRFRVATYFTAVFTKSITLFDAAEFLYGVPPPAPVRQWLVAVVVRLPVVVLDVVALVRLVVVVSNLVSLVAVIVLLVLSPVDSVLGGGLVGTAAAVVVLSGCLSGGREDEQSGGGNGHGRHVNLEGEDGGR